LLINAPPPNEKCPRNESKNYGMYDLTKLENWKWISDRLEIKSQVPGL
jgi:hypothetical protein